MAKPLVSDGLWEMLQPLPPPAKPRRFRRPGRRRIDDRKALTGILFALRSGIPWEILPKRGAGHGSRLGAYRWVVGRTLAWLHQFRRLRVRYERIDEIHEAFLSIGCSLICFRRLSSFC